MRVAVFVTCLIDGLYPQVGKAMITVLRRLGCQVVLPPQQTCCGQMHINTGYQDEALPLIRNHQQAFSGLAAGDYDAIVAASASCAGCLRHQHAEVALGHGEPELAEQARAAAAKTYELSEFLVDVLGVTEVGARFAHRVTYHPTCHSLRLLRVGDKPVQLLRAVEGIDLVELPNADSCCGFGGTFALKNAETSTAMLADKMASVATADAEFCTAADSSCLMHIGGGLSRQKSPVRAIHLAEILASTAAGVA